MHSARNSELPRCSSSSVYCDTVCHSLVGDRGADADIPEMIVIFLTTDCHLAIVEQKTHTTSRKYPEPTRGSTPSRRVRRTGSRNLRPRGRAWLRGRRGFSCQDLLYQVNGARTLCAHGEARHVGAIYALPPRTGDLGAIPGYNTLEELPAPGFDGVRDVLLDV